MPLHSQTLDFEIELGLVKKEQEKMYKSVERTINSKYKTGAERIKYIYHIEEV